MSLTRQAQGLLALSCLVALGLLVDKPSRTTESALSPAKTSELFAEPRHRGVSWVAGRPVSEEDFQPLLRNHVSWIVQTPFGWQKAHNTPEVSLVTDGRIFWGERDIGLETTTRLARKFGIKTLLKPHIWLRGAEQGKWRGHIAMDSEADWQGWFASYRRFILHYARLAERLGIEALCIGTELHATVVERPEDWRALIAEIRHLYSGQLTYAANWYREFQEVPFWDQLDYISIQAYFPLSDRERPSLEELTQGWQPHLVAIEAVQQRYAKPVLFTEIGYRSTPDAASEPWAWPRFSGHLPVDLETQARCYEAFFQTIWDRPWFAGSYFWKWYPRPRGERPENIGFTPQGKPAEKVMARWYGSSFEGEEVAEDETAPAGS